MTETPKETEEGGLLAEVKRIYTASIKKQDIAWNVWVARPVAALFLVFLRRTPLTPNQLSMIGLLLFCAVPALMIAIPDWRGFLLAAVMVEVSYIFDCCDGQLARLKKMSSTVGAYLDFFIDEVKALLLMGGATVALWRATDDVMWLLVAIGAVTVAAIATSLTTFVRRPEYAGQKIMPGADTTGPARPEGLVKGAIWLLIRTLRLIVHYPSWILFLGLAGIAPAVDPLFWFVVLYLGTYVLYLGRTSLAVVLRLGHPRFYDTDYESLD